MYDISGCNKVGKRISNEIISVFEEIVEYKDTAEFKHMVINNLYFIDPFIQKQNLHPPR